MKNPFENFFKGTKNASLEETKKTSLGGQSIYCVKPENVINTEEQFRQSKNYGTNPPTEAIHKDLLKQFREKGDNDTKRDNEGEEINNPDDRKA
jgi:hypothetical protein